VTAISFRAAANAAILSIFLWLAVPLLCSVNCLWNGEEDSCCCNSAECGQNNGDGIHEQNADTNCPCTALCTLQVCVADAAPLLAHDPPFSWNLHVRYTEVPSGFRPTLLDPPRASC
jgi:hypothetical protein